MKKSILFALVMILMLSACGGEAPDEAASPTEAGTEPVVSGETEAATTEESEGGVAGSAGLCANPYYPVAVGVTQTYSGTGGPDGDYSFAMRISEVREDGFTLITEFDGLMLTHQWACLEEGLQPLEYAEGPSAVLTTEGSEARFSTHNVVGLLLPARISVGDTWTQTYDVSGTQSIPDMGVAETSGTISYAFEAVGEESVTVPAGTFTALVIEANIAFDLEMTIEDLSIPSLFNSMGRSYYVEGVGWVKSVDRAEIFGVVTESTIELTDYSLP